MNICQYCGEEEAERYYETIHSDVVLCNPCANMIINVVHKAQYGRYLFWKEEDPEQKTYTKKKIRMSLRMQVYERDGFKCVTCGVQTKLSLDHIKPEVLGGEATLENLQTMCKSCNSRKGARYVEASN